jgi:hypothetical protein
VTNTKGLADVLPLSPLQGGMLFHADLAGQDDPDVYTVQLILTFEGPVDAARMRVAVETLLKRHANLRAGFRLQSSGTPVQLIPHAAELPWSEADLAGKGPGASTWPARPCFGPPWSHSGPRTSDCC